MNTNTRIPLPAAPGPLTPATLAQPTDVTVTSVYGYELRDSYGCHGSDAVGYLLSRSPATWPELAELRARVHAALAADKATRETAAREAAGPELRFDATFDGTRADFETALAAWQARRDAAAASLSTVTEDDAWAAHGLTLVDVCGVTAANSHYVEDDDLLVLGHEDAHHCRCSHSGITLDVPDDLDPDDPTDAHRCDPRQLALIVADGYAWLTTPDVLEDDVRGTTGPVAAAADRLRELATSWQQAVDAHAAKVADLEAALAAVPTEDQLAAMRPVEYQVALNARKAAGGLEWRLRDARRITPGRLLDAVTRELRTVPVVPGFVGRNDYGWRLGPYRTVTEELCDEVDTGTGRS